MANLELGRYYAAAQLCSRARAHLLPFQGSVVTPRLDNIATHGQLRWRCRAITCCPEGTLLAVLDGRLDGEDVQAENAFTGSASRLQQRWSNAMTHLSLQQTTSASLIGRRRLRLKRQELLFPLFPGMLLSTDSAGLCE